MQHLFALVASYGYAVTFVFLFLESVGIPIPGEGILIATALFAARTQRLEISAVIATASSAAFLGTSAGYLLGRSAGHVLIVRFGSYVGLTPARQRLGQYLFRPARREDHLSWPVHCNTSRVRGHPRWGQSDAVAEVSCVQRVGRDCLDDDHRPRGFLLRARLRALVAPIGFESASGQWDFFDSRADLRP